MKIKLERPTRDSEKQIKKEKNKYLGLAFIRTRMADCKVNCIAETMEEVANDLEVDLLDVIVDRSGSKHIDRKELDDLYEWFEVAPVNLLLLESISDITDDEADLERFKQDLDKYHVIVLCLKDHTVYYPESMEVEMDTDKE